MLTTTIIGWRAGWNQPGCLPDSDAPLPTFETFEDARTHIADEMRRMNDALDEDGDQFGPCYDEWAADVDAWPVPTDRLSHEAFPSVSVGGQTFWIEPEETP